MVRLAASLAILALAAPLSGCLAVKATSAVAGTAVGVTGDVATGAVDLVTESDEERYVKERRRERRERERAENHDRDRD